ncbi:hypothetical protein VTO42DRAFT_1141 [Malbranchea cinnamomea]
MEFIVRVRSGLGCEYLFLVAALAIEHPREVGKWDVYIVRLKRENLCGRGDPRRIKTPALLRPQARGKPNRGKSPAPA